MQNLIIIQTNIILPLNIWFSNMIFLVVTNKQAMFKRYVIINYHECSWINVLVGLGPCSSN